jgi:hypothetical protein
MHIIRNIARRNILRRNITRRHIARPPVTGGFAAALLGRNIARPGITITVIIYVSIIWSIIRPVIWAIMRDAPDAADPKAQGR